jgi:predicted transcriptional regulator
MKPRDITITDKGVMLALWRQRLDTLDIARKLNLWESQVYNYLFCGVPR